MSANTPKMDPGARMGSGVPLLGGSDAFCEFLIQRPLRVGGLTRSRSSSEKVDQIGEVNATWRVRGRNLGLHKGLHCGVGLDRSYLLDELRVEPRPLTLELLSALRKGFPHPRSVQHAP